jgi:hypothetical protein
VAPALDLNALSMAICKGVVEGNAPLVTMLSTQGEKRHDLRNSVQENTDKVYALDSEVKLLKGVIVSLVGDGTGSSGMVPRLERDLHTLGSDMSAVKTEMREVRADVSGIRDDIKAIRSAQSEQRSWIDGASGAGAVGKFLIGACIAVIGGVITVLVWLFGHGIKP